MHSKIKEWPVTSVKRSGGRLSWCQHCWKSTFISLSACAFLLGVRCEFLNLYIGTPKEKEVIFAAKKRRDRDAVFFLAFVCYVEREVYVAAKKRQRCTAGKRSFEGGSTNNDRHSASKVPAATWRRSFRPQWLSWRRAW